MARVVTFGEIMLRLAPNGYERIFQSDQMQATFGGGEANVAVSLANFGVDSRYVTKLPKHAIGQAAVNALRYFGVDTSDSCAAATAWACIILKRARRSAEACAFTIVRIRRFRKQIRLNSTGRAFWTARTGFILQELRPRSAKISSKRVSMRAGRRAKRESPSPAI